MMAVEAALREAGVRSRLGYKPDVFSACGVYHDNEWGVKPNLHYSR